VATKECLMKQLEVFRGMAGRPIAEDAFQALLTAYNATFGGVPDSTFTKACEAYLKDGKYFPPRPAELAEMMPRQSERQPVEEGDYRIRQQVQCGKCRKIAQCIQEPALGGPLLCRECYTGMTPQQFKKNMDALSRINAQKGVYGVYDKKTKTVNLTGTPVEKQDDATDLFGG